MKLSERLRAIPDGRPWFYYGEEGDEILRQIEELERDAALGALVRRMPFGMQLSRGYRDNTFAAGTYKHENDFEFGDTPEEALTNAIEEAAKND